MVRIKRGLAGLLVAALLAFGAFALVSCGPSAEEVVREGVTKELDSLKNLDASLVDELAASAGVEQLADFGIDAKEFVSTYLGGFDYRIDDVTVNGDAATATVTLTCKSFAAYTDALEAASAELAGDESLADLSEEELNQKLGQTIMDAIAAVPATETAPVALTFERKDNVWTPTADAQHALSNALFSN
ncbi:hypothetical protein [Arabiibacter massiliensis]|uniref:hypothetical protein n=1 Tax=Arabiibacter massiliensis TaxID=1870985 RepID=UPI0009B9B14E|nr:hypothetical protein [Arabiibacter massiliensis]